jgi:hypothetical protein
MPVHYKGKTGKARKKALAEHKAIKKQKGGYNSMIDKMHGKV